MVEYKISQNNILSDDFSQSLRETYEFFKQSENVSILGEGIKDILSDNTLFEQYVDKLVEGTSASEEQDLRALMDNARLNTLAESSTSGIAPVASLTFPSIRKLWARTGIIKAMPTEVVKSNAFTVSFNRPYIIDEQGERHYLPEAIRDPKASLGTKKRLSTDAITLPAVEKDLLAMVGCSKATGDSIDMDFAISEVTYTPEGGEATTIKIARKNGYLDPQGLLSVEVKDADGELIDTVFGRVNLTAGTMNAVALNGKIDSVKIKGYVASDAHNRATNISFEMTKRDFTIGTGEHFEASLPLEFLQDAMATYQIDGTTEVVDTMTNIIAQKLDQELINFLGDMLEGTNYKYLGEFDMRPSASFTGSPKEWREEMKTVIDYYAQKLKSDTYAYQGYFAIFGHSIDMMLIPNVSWTFNHTTDTMSGVEVDYNIGALSGTNRYTLVTSDLIPQGRMFMLFIPTTNKFKTAVYYPYTFNVVNNYLNTQRSNIPNIMMTKRQTYEEFLPLIGAIDVINNTGSMINEIPRMVDLVNAHRP